MVWSGRGGGGWVGGVVLLVSCALVSWLDTVAFSSGLSVFDAWIFVFGVFLKIQIHFLQNYFFLE